jgi:hypothetical protein
MARITDKQRLQRVVEFLTGLHHPDVRKALAPRGFTSAEAKEGFRLLRATIEAFHSASGAPPAPPDALVLLDAWENRWLPIARAALTRHFPELAKSVFVNISQTSGASLVVTLPALLERIKSLESGNAKHQRARALLAQRGLTDAVLNEAQTLLGELAQAPATEPEAPRLREPTLDALWSWYLEWSQTARATLEDPKLLRVLGFGKR